MGSKQEINLVVSYMKSQNRPHNASTVFLNLQKRVGKTAIERILETSEDKGIVQKLNGKQVIFYAKQEAGDTNLPETLKKLDESIVEKKADAAALQKQVDELERKNATLVTEPVDAVLRTRIAELDAANFDKRNRLSAAKGLASNMTAADQKKISTAREKMTKNWRKRKAVVTNVVGMILEGGYQKKKKHLEEDIGIETDEAHKLDVNSF